MFIFLELPKETIINADYADDLVLSINAPIQAKSLLHSLEQVAKGIGLYISTVKTEFKYLKKEKPSPEIRRPVHIPW